MINGLPVLAFDAARTHVEERYCIVLIDEHNLYIHTDTVTNAYATRNGKPAAMDNTNAVLCFKNRWSWYRSHFPSMLFFTLPQGARTCRCVRTSMRRMRRRCRSIWYWHILEFVL
ncbi:hypothetical protein MRB53_037157 [Persea americana]|nr:hypothetical protein MRB53_037157 [Persea americana]